MAYAKKTWKDRVTQYLNRRLLTDANTGDTQLVTVTRDEGNVTEAGDTFSAANMNDLEDRIDDAFTEVTTLKSITLLANTWSAGVYTATVAGVTASDNYEIIGFTPTNDVDDDTDIKEQIGFILYGVCGSGTITFYASDDPDVDLPIIIRKVVGTIS